MSLWDWFEDKADKAMWRMEDKFDEKLEKLDTRVDAALGLGEYENASLEEKLQGLTGKHDNGVLAKWSEKKNTGLEPGDVVGVTRTGYEHYGVYIGNKRVIHYTSESSDIGGNNKITKTSFSRFMRGADEYFVLVFPDEHREPSRAEFSYSGGIALGFYNQVKELFELISESDDYILYSNRDTVERAKSRLGEKDYNLVVNNCEHFAIWCKTGISESYQIKKMLNRFKGSQLKISRTNLPL
ncbi:MAG: lecithin retinol acyltransferase family protein [Bacillota bacterium]